jgi:hypothetical protein
MMKVVRMMVIIPHVMVEEPHKMAKALHILTEAPLEKTLTVLAFHKKSLMLKSLAISGISVITSKIISNIRFSRIWVFPRYGT